MNALQQLYRRTRKNLLQKIRRGKKAGFEYDINIPKIPKKITEASINKLNKYTSEYLAKHSRYIDHDTGEILTGVQGKKLRKQNASRKRQETIKRKKEANNIPILPPDDFYADAVITNFLRQVNDYKNGRGTTSQYVYSWLEDAIANYGKRALAEAIETAYANGYEYDRTVAYNYAMTTEFIKMVMQNVPDSEEYNLRNLSEMIDENLVGDFIDYEEADEIFGM